MGSVKDRNGMDSTEEEDIKKSWQEYTEETYKKDLHDQDNHDSVITHLEPDILECEVKWVLESITTNSISPFSLPFPLKIIILCFYEFVYFNYFIYVGSCNLICSSEDVEAT